MVERPALDAFDRKILEVVATNGRISIAELAGRVGLSKSPVQARLRRLEAKGVIRGYRAMLDSAAMGREHVAFVEVKLSDTRERALAQLNAAVLRLPEIEACHMIAGKLRLPSEGKDERDVRLPGGAGRAHLDAAACGGNLDLCGDADGEGRRVMN